MSNDDLDWERQRAFLAVLRAGSLSGAARTLGLAQPTVRRRIADLEATLGAVLFTRTPAGLSPTPTALVLADHAEAMAHAASAFARAASAEADAIAGEVRITASEIVAIEVLPPILAELRALHPGLVPVLSPTNRVEDVLRREADIAIRMTPPRQDALVAQRIGAIPLGIFGHRDCFEQSGMPGTIADLSRYGLIGPEHDNAIPQAIRAAGFPLDPASFVFRSDSDLAHLAAIRSGVGIGLCQVPLGTRDPALVRLFPDFAFDLETWVVTHEDLRGVARIRATFDHLVAGLRAYIALSV